MKGVHLYRGNRSLLNFAKLQNNFPPPAKKEPFCRKLQKNKQKNPTHKWVRGDSLSSTVLPSPPQSCYRHWPKCFFYLLIPHSGPLASYPPPQTLPQARGHHSFIPFEHPLGSRSFFTSDLLPSPLQLTGPWLSWVLSSSFEISKNKKHERSWRINPLLMKKQLRPRTRKRPAEVHTVREPAGLGQIEPTQPSQRYYC